MKRRDFLFGLGTSIVALDWHSSHSAASGEKYSKRAAPDTLQLPTPSTPEQRAAGLHRIFDIKVNITFDTSSARQNPAQFGTFNGLEQQQINRAATLWCAVWSSEEFKNRVMNAKFSDTSDTPEQVYRNITEVKSKSAHYRLHIHHEKSSERASTNNNSITTLPKAYLDGKAGTSANLINTLSHEYTHTKESHYYQHSKYCTRWRRNTMGRPLTVPYQIGCITQHILFPCTQCEFGCDGSNPAADNQQPPTPCTS